MTESATAAPQAKHATAHRWLRLTLLCWLTLIALLLVWHQRMPTGQPLISLLLALLPLLLPAPWLLRGSRNACLAMAVIALLYFCHAIVALVSSVAPVSGGKELPWAIAELLVSCCLFLSSTLTARLLR